MCRSELEQAKRMVTGAADRQGSEDEGEGEGNGEGVMSVGDWWMEGGMGVIDVGEMLARHLRARNLRTIAPYCSDSVLITDYGV